MLLSQPAEMALKTEQARRMLSMLGMCYFRIPYVERMDRSRRAQHVGEE